MAGGRATLRTVVPPLSAAMARSAAGPLRGAAVRLPGVAAQQVGRQQRGRGAHMDLGGDDM
jgi:hypothetical protein